MKLGKRATWSLALALLLPATVFAGGFNLAGVGMKALGMSGAYRAISDDWSAMYWNPAGLAGQESGFWIEAKVLYPNTRVTPNAPSTIPGYDGYYLYRNGVEQSSVNGGRPTGSAAFQYQFSDRLTAGVSVFTPSALGADWNDLFIGPYVGYGDNPAYPDEDWVSSMYVIDIHPTVGYQVTDWLKAGIGLSIKYTSIELKTPVLQPGIDPATGQRLPLPGSHYFVDATLTGDGVGFGFNVGLIAQATEKLAVGVAYTGPAVVPIEGNLEQTVYLPAMAGAGTLDADPVAKADFPIPMELGLGLAYDFSDAFTLAADIKWVNWGDLDEVPIEVDGAGPSGAPADDTELILKWDDSIRFNVGASYDVSDALQLRAGYYFDPTPIPDETMRPTISDVADKHSVSVGLGYAFGNGFTIDGTYQHLWGGDNEVEAFDNDGDGMYDNVPGAWSMQVITMGVQLGYRF